MRKLILSFVIIISIMISSCEKNKVKLSLQGKWEIVNISIVEVENGVKIYEENYLGKPGDYIDFRSDNKVYSEVDGVEDVGNYTLLKDNKVIVEGDTLEIRSLTKSSVTLFLKSYTNSTSFDESTINLIR
ncbi:MAG: hypothetical protein ABIN48_13325 [Ginsengibacter sp.]